MQLVYQDRTTRVYYLEGRHHSRLLPNVSGKAVIFLRMRPVMDERGSDAMESTMVAYTMLDNRVLSGFVSLLRPLVDATVMRKLSKGVEMVNRLGLEIGQPPDRVLFEATDPPSLPEQDVAFLTQALSRRHTSSAHSKLPASGAMTTARSFTLLCTIGVFVLSAITWSGCRSWRCSAESLGASPERIGVIVSVSTLTGVLLKLPSGALSDIYGRRILLRVGVIAFGLPPVSLSLHLGFESAHIVTALPRLGEAALAAQRARTVADLYRERRGAALGTYTACTQSGALLGPFIGGYLAFASGFSSAFLTAGLFGCIAIVLFYSLRLTPPPPRVIRTRGWRRW